MAEADADEPEAEVETAGTGGAGLYTPGRAGVDSSTEGEGEEGDDGRGGKYMCTCCVASFRQTTHET